MTPAAKTLDNQTLDRRREAVAAGSKNFYTVFGFSRRRGQRGRYVAWDLELATLQKSHETDQTPRWHFVASGVALSTLAAMLAPGDGGILLNHWVVVIMFAHVGFYLLHFSINPYDHRAALTRLTSPMKCFLFSIVCVILITVALLTGAIPEYFGLADLHTSIAT